MSRIQRVPGKTVCQSMAFKTIRPVLLFKGDSKLKQGYARINNQKFVNIINIVIVIAVFVAVFVIVGAVAAVLFLHIIIIVLLKVVVDIDAYPK